jgi:hypothetical protein
MTRHRQPLEAAISELTSLAIWLAPDLGMQHPSYGALHGTLIDVRAALQRAVDDPRGDAPTQRSQQGRSGP